MSSPPLQCFASYSVTFSVGALPNGSVDVYYTWHMVNSTAKPVMVTLKANSSQSYETRESAPNGTTTGDVYVTWTADGSIGTSNKVPVTFFCTT